MGIEAGILLIVAGLALMKLRKNPTGETKTPDLEENPYVEPTEKKNDLSPFPSLETGTAFSDEFFGWPEENNGYVDTPMFNDFLGSDDQKTVSSSAPALTFTPKPTSLGTEKMGTSPGFVDYENQAPMSNPQQESRNAISYNTMDYVPTSQEANPKPIQTAPVQTQVEQYGRLPVANTAPAISSPSDPRAPRQSFSLLTSAGLLPFAR